MGRATQAIDEAIRNLPVGASITDFGYLAGMHDGTLSLNPLAGRFVAATPDSAVHSLDPRLQGIADAMATNQLLERAGRLRST